MEWINTKDKLPNPDEYVLAYISGFRVQRLKGGNPAFTGATHWMSLPEPPPNKALHQTPCAFCSNYRGGNFCANCGRDLRTT